MIIHRNAQYIWGEGSIELLRAGVCVHALANFQTYPQDQINFSPVGAFIVGMTDVPEFNGRLPAEAEQRSDKISLLV